MSQQARHYFVNFTLTTVFSSTKGILFHQKCVEMKLKLMRCNTSEVPKFRVAMIVLGDLKGAPNSGLLLQWRLSGHTPQRCSGLRPPKFAGLVVSHSGHMKLIKDDIGWICRKKLN